MARRFGRIYISQELLDPQLVEVFYLMKFLPCRVEYLFEFEDYHYIGYSPLFRVLSTGESIPEYTLTVTNDTAGRPIKAIVVETTKEKGPQK